MKLREVIVKNFRCLKDVSIPLTDNTVLIGENNSGKTALLEALRIALPRALVRANPFNEYDYFMMNEKDSPKTSEGIIIELWFREDYSDEWPDSIVQDLNEIIQTDPNKDLDSIGLRLSGKYDEGLKEINVKWEFLALNGEPLAGKGSATQNFRKFLSYVRCFYLASLRDSINEFSPRSQFWGPILRDLKISDEQRLALGVELTKLNQILLKEDERLEQVINTLDRVQQILEIGAGQKTSIQALPLRPWDLLSRSEVVIKSRGSEIDIPLVRHGQGMQSLAVLFLFQAYIEVLLKPTFLPETEAILALEEPESHLHPQASRALAASLDRIQSQKIVATHCPYFIQEIPFKQIRMFRRSGPISKVLYISQSYSAILPENPRLLTFCGKNPTKFSYDKDSSTFYVNGKINETEYRELLIAYQDRGEIHKDIRKIKELSQYYLSEDELSDLETFAKRIRGEVLFARAWLLCEGQSEYLLIRFFAELLGTPLDRAGITVIDFQNNGSPGAFVGLAQVFEIPWLMFCDNDDGGKKFISQVKNRMVIQSEINDHVYIFPEEGMDLEMFLVKNGFKSEYSEIIIDNNEKLANKEADIGFDEEMASILRKNKTAYVIALINKLTKMKADNSRVPQFFKEIINKIIAKVA